MKVPATSGAAIRYARVFNKPTKISIQVPNNQIVYIGHEQSEADSTHGLVIPGPSVTVNAGFPYPYDTEWQGELWYQAAADFVIVTREATS